ncbi:MAG: leucine-rich repeat domain-containing protein [Ruminococcus sp.]|nr:leucine-rich repeat domain-containing protein [Ruminococcus sp.]
MGDFQIENGVLKKYTGNDTVVTISDSVTEIGRRAFYGCESLERIIIPNGENSQTEKILLKKYLKFKDIISYTK